MPTAPRYPHRPVTRSWHGRSRTDDLDWLRDKSSPEVVRMLEAENAYAQDRLASTAHLRAQMAEEMRGRIVETDATVPSRMGDWWYYARTEAGREYRVYCRAAYVPGEPRPEVQGVVPVTEQVILDCNALAEGHEFFTLGALEITHDGRRAVYSVDVAGDELFALCSLDLTTGEVSEEGVRDIGYDLAWALDGRHVFYTRSDEAWRTYQVWRHELGTDPGRDVLVYEEPDEQFSVSVANCRDERWLLITTESRTTSDEQLIDGADPTAAPRRVWPRQEGVQYYVEPAGDRLLILTNVTDPEYDLREAPFDTTGPEQSRVVLAPGTDENLHCFDAFAGFVVVNLRSEGRSAVRVALRDAAGDLGAWHDLPVEGELTVVGAHGPTHYDSDTIEVVTTSLAHPQRTYDYDPRTRELPHVRTERPPHHDPSRYREWREWAVAPDGTRVPVSCIALADREPDGTGAALLYGYGAYETVIEPEYRPHVFPLVDRGAVYAIAHVRGGGEMGRGWWEHGRLGEKPNTFTDFLAAADRLVELGWADPGRLGAQGRSAGGLLIGAAVNLAPDRFRVVHAGVPFVDALTSMLDSSLPLTVGEWEEWGDPEHDPAAYDVIAGYSPYDNIQAKDYPAILATTSLNDTRVLYVEPAKWVARLRETVTSDPAERPILLTCEMVAGHFGRSGRYAQYDEHALEYAFVAEQLGLG